MFDEEQSDYYGWVDKYCCESFDYITLKKGLIYNKVTDQVESSGL